MRKRVEKSPWPCSRRDPSGHCKHLLLRSWLAGAPTPPAGLLCWVVPSWPHTSTSSHSEEGQSLIRQTLVPERGKKCHPPSIGSCGLFHCLPWKPPSLKYKLLCRGRLTVWDIFQTSLKSRRYSATTPPQRRPSLSRAARLAALDSCLGAGWGGTQTWDRGAPSQSLSLFEAPRRFSLTAACISQEPNVPLMEQLLGFVWINCILKGAKSWASEHRGEVTPSLLMEPPISVVLLDA